ncbi:16S rRNA (guanine(966)-N(2))-methyltransferase RsmD [Microbacterium sp. NPDC078428]|uniref:16S rRNA (guanine(966)-N(2))-methyltransferase RsmD n=1 Tax=Microbacterium sp. NPDC078428 TaxID=3364190 RepID=UPI0037C5B5A0
MTRIIAGRAGSLPLAVPAAGTRPTSDRVRESLFAGLESADAIEDARVLDLYAGSGALGLEALSRGAASVDLVEKASSAAAVAERNARRVAAAVGSGDARVHRMSAEAFLRSTSATWDLVFLDPPYDHTDAALTDALAALVPHLGARATVILERSRRSPAPALPEGLQHRRERRYGDTTLWWVSVAS